MKKRFSEAQIIGFLKEVDAGVAVKDLCRRHGFSEASYYLWRSKSVDHYAANAPRSGRRVSAAARQFDRPRPNGRSEGLLTSSISKIRLRHWPAEQANPKIPPLLLVPGAFNSIKLWEDRFAPAWAAAGIDTWALDFRSNQAGPLRRHALGLRDYREDLSDAIAQLPRPPVVLGYSLGGRVTLELAAQTTLPGMVLLNALPARGAHEVILEYARQAPVSLGKFLCLSVASPIRRLSLHLPAGIASPQADGRLKESFVDGLRGESLRVLAESMLPARSTRYQAPALVIGMSGDRLIPPSVAQRLAADLNAELLLLEGLSHTPMIEPAGFQVVDAVAAWIKGLRVIPSQ